MAIGKNSEYTDSMGRFRTKSLFVETVSQSGYLVEPMYSLKGKKGFIDLHDMYLEASDPTEYKFAMLAFDSWKHFMHLASLKWFKLYLDDWREELEIKLRSSAIVSIMDSAVNDGSKGTSAAKWIADRGWDKKRGRPSKEEVERELKVSARITDDVSEDAKRLGLH